MNPLRAVLVVLATGAAVVVLYALFIDNSQTKLPLLVASLAIFGIVLALLGFVLAGSAVRLGEAGRMGRALLVAFIGGLFVLVAAGAVGFAIVLGILAGGIG